MAFGTKELEILKIVYHNHIKTGRAQMALEEIGPLEGYKIGIQDRDTLINLDELGYLSYRYTEGGITLGVIMLDERQIQKIKEELAK